MAAAVRRNAAGAEIVELSSGSIERHLGHLGAAEGKRVLLIRRFLGRAFKRCQGFKTEYACCNLHTISEGNACTLECTYCILQYYMTAAHVSVFANLDDIQADVASALAEQPRRILRVTTGELADSLLLDPLTETAPIWIRFFGGLRDRNAVLELKTKTNHVAGVLGCAPDGRTVVSWSVNPPELIEREELKTASLEERLQAAGKVARRGFPVGFHLDPMIHYRGWREGYASLLDSLLEAVPPDRIAWISLGSLRFPVQLKAALIARFPRSELRLGELVPCPDGKMRYIRPLRLEMFRWAVDHLQERLSGCLFPPLIYLCMEPADTWKRVFGVPGPTSAELDFQFAESYSRRFPEAGLPQTAREDYAVIPPDRAST